MQLSRIIISTALSTLLLTSVTSASACCGINKCKPVCCLTPSLHDGFYVGVQAGYDSYRIRQNLGGSGSIDSDSSGQFNITSAYTGWVGGLFSGYGKVFCNNLYLGAEAFANYNGNSETVSFLDDGDGDIARQRLKIKETYGISLLPGIKMFNNVLAYLRVGYDWTKFESNTNASNIDENEIFIASVSRSFRQGGWRLGLGLETVLYCNWSVRGEYNHIWYTSKTFDILGSSNRFKASDNQVMAGIVYHIM